MNSEKQYQEPEFDGVYLTGLLFKHKWYLIAVFVLASVVSAIYSYGFMPNWYAATANAVPPQQSGSGMESAIGGISSALKDMGLSKVGGSTETGYSLYVVLDSRSIKDSMINKYKLDIEYDIPKSQYSDLIKAFEGNLSINVGKEGNYAITISDKDPKRAADMANDFIYFTNIIAEELFRREQTTNREYMQQRINSIDSLLSVNMATLSKYSSEKMMYSPTDQAKAASTALAEMKASIYKYEIEYDLMKSNYGEADQMTSIKKDMLDKSRQKYNQLLTQPGFIGNFSVKDGAGVAMNYLKASAEIEALTKTKVFLVPSLEKLKLDETKNLKNLMVLDKATPPDKKDRPKRSVIVLGSAFGSLFLACFVIILIYSFKNFTRKLKEREII